MLLSPESPARQVDEETCTSTLSTKVTDDLRPYAFTPTLETVGAGATRRFCAALAPVEVSSQSCAVWTIHVEYAFIAPDAATRFQRRPSEDFRRYVLVNQKMMSATGTANP